MPNRPSSLRAALTQGARLVAQLLRMHPWAYVAAVVGSILFVSAIVASAIVIGRVTDELIIPVLDGKQPVSGRLGPAIFAIVAVGVWKAAGIVLRRSAAGLLQYRTQRDVRVRLIDHLMRLDLGWFRRQATGDLLSVTDHDSRTATFILAPLPYATGSILLLVGTVAIVAAVDVVMAAAALAAIVVISGTDIHGSWRTFALFENEQRLRGEVASVAHESFDGALTVKALGREHYESSRFATSSDSLRHAITKVNTVWNIYRVIVEGLLAVVAVVVLIVGAIRIRAGAVTPGEVISIAYLFSLLYIPLRIIGFVLWDLAHSAAAWQRVEAVQNADDLIGYGSTRARRHPRGAEVTGADVDFGYDDALVLRGVSLAIRPGQVVAIVGPTASGKSTLATLFARLWDPNSGKISIDGVDLREFARSALPGEVAFVAQETFLFDDTVFGNIAFGADADADAVAAAARLAAADDFVRELPEGYDTLLGERGATLSGGQRQRIALARALVRKPRLLILDDATSAVDPSVETRILRGLREADLPATVVVVAYRRSSITLADEVVYMEGGRLVAHGRHEELLQLPGYARLLDAYDQEAGERQAKRGTTP